MVRILYFQCWGLGSIPGQGTKIPQATCQKKKKKSVRSQRKKGNSFWADSFPSTGYSQSSGQFGCSALLWGSLRRAICTSFSKWLNYPQLDSLLAASPVSLHWRLIRHVTYGSRRNPDTGNSHGDSWKAVAPLDVLFWASAVKLLFVWPPLHPQGWASITGEAEGWGLQGGCNCPHSPQGFLGRLRVLHGTIGTALAWEQIANIRWIIEKASKLQKNIYFCFIDYVKAFDCIDLNELWKILQEMGLPNHLTCLLRNLYAGREATGRTRHGTTNWFQIEKWIRQGCMLSPCLFNLHAEYIMRNAGLDEAQAGIKIAGGISVTSDMQMTPLLR